MAHQQRLVETLVELADTLVAEYDVIDFMQTLAERCVELLERLGRRASCSPTARGNCVTRRVPANRCGSWSSSNCRSEQGPCFDAFREERGRPSATRPTTRRAGGREFAPQAREGGFAAVDGGADAAATAK